MKKIMAVLFLGCISSAALADAADQAVLRVYKLARPGHAVTQADLKPDSLVLQQAEIIEPAEDVAGMAEQSFNLEGAKYSYSVSYTPEADYESSSVKLVVETGTDGHPVKTASYDVTLQSGQTRIVKVGSYAIAVTMQPAVDDGAGI